MGRAFLKSVTISPYPFWALSPFIPLPKGSEKIGKIEAVRKVADSLFAKWGKCDSIGV